MVDHLKQHILLYVLGPLLILTVGASYYRYMVSYDYLVRYEGDCDPYTEICFQYCEDESCNDPSYYTWITREASVIKANCVENDVTLCEFAYTCEAGEENCTITHCDTASDTDECEFLEESDRPQTEQGTSQNEETPS